MPFCIINGLTAGGFEFKSARAENASHPLMGLGAGSTTRYVARHPER